MVIDDQTLLRRYCADGDDEAFGELVRRHLGFVYSAALRQVRDVALAEDATQIVFTRLAQRAHRLPKSVVLAGWLHADTRLTALQLLRSEQRRRTREARASEMQQLNSSLEPDWAKIRPVLDEALEKLGRADRDALLLRFFEQRSLREVGTTLGLAEDAARMRVSRALDRLRALLEAQGISTAGAALSAALTTYGTQAAPPALAASVTACALAAGTSTTEGILGLITMSKVKLAIFGTVFAAGTATVLWQQHANSSLRAQNQAMRSELEQLRQTNEEAQTDLQALASESERLRKQAGELAALRGALAQLRQEQAARKAAAPSSAAQPPVDASAGHPQEPVVSEAEITAFLQRPKAEQGEVLGQLRRQMTTPGSRPGDDFARNRALATQVRPKLEELEARPQEFAEFQSSFIKAAVGLEDEGKVGQIRQIVQQVYEDAVAEKLHAQSRPQEGVEAWALRRDALDRRATHDVQQLLTSEERARFDRAFLGVMGIDLGSGDGAWHRFVRPDGSIVFPSQEPGQ